MLHSVEPAKVVRECVCSAFPLNHIFPTDASSSVSIVLILTKSNLKALNNSQYTFGVIVSRVALIIVSAISISVYRPKILVSAIGNITKCILVTKI